jgi:hypothetical protein
MSGLVHDDFDRQDFKPELSRQVTNHASGSNLALM